jgi:hypothetical protein
MGELAIVEHVLESPETRRRYVSHLSPAEWMTWW